MGKAASKKNDLPAESDFKKAMRFMKTERKRMKELIAQEEMMLFPSQAAAMIGISPQAMERKIKEGSIRSFECLGKIWVSGRQIDELMNERIASLVKAGVDKNKIEQGIYKKMYLNAKLMKAKKQKTKSK